MYSESLRFVLARNCYVWTEKSFVFFKTFTKHFGSNERSTITTHDQGKVTFGNMTNVTSSRNVYLTGAISLR